MPCHIASQFSLLAHGRARDMACLTPHWLTPTEEDLHTVSVLPKPQSCDLASPSAGCRRSGKVLTDLHSNVKAWPCVGLSKAFCLAPFSFAGCRGGLSGQRNKLTKSLWYPYSHKQSSYNGNTCGISMAEIGPKFGIKTHLYCTASAFVLLWSFPGTTQAFFALLLYRCTLL